MAYRKAIASMSLGRAAVHDFRYKMDQAHKYGFEGLELFYEDLEKLADSYPGGAAKQENHVKAAWEIRRLCDERNIEVLCLQPFYQYEGLRDRTAHARQIEKLHFWFELCKILNTNTIQIPSAFLSTSELTDDLNVIVADLQEVADLGLLEQPQIRFAYESLSFATYINTWEQCWNVIHLVDRPNFGACLDTFNIAARVYADPASPTFCTPNAEADTRASMERLLTNFDPAKLYYVQVVDAEKLTAPLVEGHEYYNAAQTPRLSWSRNCRLFYGEEDRGAYLPIRLICETIFHGLGFDGWVSMEYFNRDMAYTDPTIPEQLARRGAEAYDKLVQDLDLPIEWVLLFHCVQ